MNPIVKGREILTQRLRNQLEQNRVKPTKAYNQ